MEGILTPNHLYEANCDSTTALMTHVIGHFIHPVLKITLNCGSTCL